MDLKSISLNPAFFYFKIFQKKIFINPLMENEMAYSKKFLKDYNEINHTEMSDAALSGSVKQYVNDMYEEFKKCFEQKNFLRIDKIIKNIENVDTEANVLNSIFGHLCLLKGEGIEAYNYLFKYSQNILTADVWALNAMAMWNQITGENDLALDQFSQAIEGAYSNKFLVTLLINAAKTKKRMGFLDKSLEYFERLMCIPEGFQVGLLIKLEIIHICILKKSYDVALNEIDNYLQRSNNCFIRRLKVYLIYLQKNYKEILKLKKNEEELDPYICYIIAKIGLENSRSFNIDVPFYLDEAVKGSKYNKYIYNTYGNYYTSINRFSDAAEQYNNALSLDPKFQPAISNMSLFVQANTTSSQPIYVTRDDAKGDFVLSDVNPDIEELGFLDTWKLLGYSSFHVDYHFLKRSPSLKYYMLDE